ncbi:MAG TPA: septal ring lytic transglycosylase RlpA family protein [Gammaproteobacteria bacterium]|nr:septal ring lytic transglycosylase RlpA family protein [Gammaproteobacteria bacterium]
MSSPAITIAHFMQWRFISSVRPYPQSTTHRLMLISSLGDIIKRSIIKRSIIWASLSARAKNITQMATPLTMRIAQLLIPGLLLAGCGTTGDKAPDMFVRDNTPNAVPANEPLSRYGNPTHYTVRGKTYQVLKNSSGFTESGVASWYGTKFHGRKTSSGEPYNMYAMTAAHKTLPLPTYVEVTHRGNGRKIIVKVNDRGPFHDGRIIDLSYAAARKLGISATGTGPVSIRVINTSALDLKTSEVVLPEAVHHGGKIHVQVAAMGTEAAADKMADKLRKNHMQSVRVHVTQSDGKKLYRVRIGPLPDVDLAYQVISELNKIGMQTARVVVD